VVAGGVVVDQPDGACCGAGVGVAVALPVGPFAGEGLLVSLDFSVAFGGATRNSPVADVV